VLPKIGEVGGVISRLRTLFHWRETMPRWLIIQALDYPWGSIINVDKIDSVKLTPKIDEDGKATGEVQVTIHTECTQQALTYPDLPTAQKEYFRISNELRGVLLKDHSDPRLPMLPPEAMQQGLVGQERET
jgi:hypothetical protein